MTLELSLERWFPVELGQAFQTERDAHAGPHGRKGQGPGTEEQERSVGPETGDVGKQARVQ